MNNLLVAVNVLIALTELFGRVSVELQRVGGMIQTAQAEGRDLTDAEMAEIETARQQAVAKWQALAADKPRG